MERHSPEHGFTSDVDIEVEELIKTLDRASYASSGRPAEEAESKQEAPRTVDDELFERFGNWWSQSECQGADADLFFPDRGASTKKARAMCSDCQVRNACLITALATGERFGVWGGASERVRRALGRVLNQGGTWDDIIEIQEQARKKDGGFKTGTMRTLAIEHAKQLEEPAKANGRIKDVA